MSDPQVDDEDEADKPEATPAVTVPTAPPRPATADIALELLAKPKVFEPLVVGGVEFWLRMPTVSERQQLGRKSGIKAVQKHGKMVTVGEPDSVSLATEAILMMVHDAQHQKLFKREQAESLAQVDAGSTIDQLGKSCLEMLQRGSKTGKE